MATSKRVSRIRMSSIKVLGTAMLRNACANSVPHWTVRTGSALRSRNTTASDSLLQLRNPRFAASFFAISRVRPWVSRPPLDSSRYDVCLHLAGWPPSRASPQMGAGARAGRPHRSWWRWRWRQRGSLRPLDRLIEGDKAPQGTPLLAVHTRLLRLHRALGF